MSQLNDLLHQVRHDVRRTWQYRWVGVIAAWATAVIGAVGIALYKDRYEASAKVFVDTQTVLKPLMQGLAFQPDIDQQVRMLARTLISRPTVEQLLRSGVLGRVEQGPAFDREVDRLKDRIKFEFSGSSNLYAISYRDTDPQNARRLVESLVGVFMASGTQAKQRDSVEASKFIDEQIKSYEGKLSEAENRLKDFKLKHMEVTGNAGANQDYYGRITALGEQVSKLRLDLTAAEQSRDALKRELASEDPQLPPESMPMAQQAAQPTETESRLLAARRQLDELLRRYTESHPDVVATQRTIAQLEAQRRHELEALAASKPRSGAAATNPVFQRLRVSLAEAEANVASLRSQLSVQQGRLDQARSMAGRVPQAEAELAQLNRDYEVMKRNYEQLVSRREAAALGVKIDQSASLADFRVVEPPRVDSIPVKPSRQLLSLALLPMALLVGLGAAFGATRLVSTVDDERSLKELTGRAVLGTVSLVVGDSMRAAASRQKLWFGLSTGALVLACLGWVLTISKLVHP